MHPELNYPLLQRFFAPELPEPPAPCAMPLPAGPDTATHDFLVLTQFPDFHGTAQAVR